MMLLDQIVVCDFFSVLVLIVSPVATRQQFIYYKQKDADGPA